MYLYYEVNIIIYVWNCILRYLKIIIKYFPINILQQGTKEQILRPSNKFTSENNVY